MATPPSPERLAVTPAVRERLFEHAREGRDAPEGPVEVCGVLGGDPPDGDGRARVTVVESVPNVAADPRARYEFDPGAAVAAIEAVEAGATHLGFYHSHPEGPRGPSRTDRARASWPGYVYLIVSLGERPVVGAWRFTGEAFVQLPVAVAD